MKRTTLIGLAFFSMLIGVFGMSSPQHPKDVKPALTPLQQQLKKEYLIVHEWGVFTIFNDVKYANINRAREWGDLPDFFYRQFPTERLHWVPAGWDKPIIYFYTKGGMGGRLEVKVTFTEGVPVVWWPAASEPVNGLWPTPNGRSNVPHRSPLFRSLTWSVELGSKVARYYPAQGSNAIRSKIVDVKEFPLPANSWLNEARIPDADLVTAVGTPVHPARSVVGGGDHRNETERFIYYDGLVPAPDYLRCENVDAGAVTLHNRASFDIARLFVVDRREKGIVRFAVLDDDAPRFRPGDRLTIETKPVAIENWPNAGVRHVRRALLQVGLFEAEVHSILRIWRKGLFENGGVTVFHILPQSEYDRMLPLEIKHWSGKPLRVGIAFHPHVEIEPAINERVNILLRQLDSPSFPIRSAASKELLEIGPMAVTALQAGMKKNISPEMRRRIDNVLETVDALKWLDPPKSDLKVK